MMTNKKTGKAQREGIHIQFSKNKKKEVKNKIQW